MPFSTDEEGTYREQARRFRLARLEQLGLGGIGVLGGFLGFGLVGAHVADRGDG